MTEQPAEEPGNGVAVHDPDNQLDTLPPAQPPSMSAMTTLSEHVGAMREAKWFAEGMCYTALVPERFRGKPGDGAAAILYGAELGLSPIASLRSIIVIHGMPGLEARTMKALLKGKGYAFRTVEKSATAYEIWAWEPGSPRVYDDEGYRINPDEVSRYTMERAERAGYVPAPTANSQRRPGVQADWVTVTRNGKTSIFGNMKYITEPENMLKAKATAEVCRDIAPHILLGLPYAAEELDDFDDDEDQSTPAARSGRPGGKGVNRLRERAAEAAGRKAGNQFAESVEAEVVDDPQPETAPAPAPDDTTTAPVASTEPAPASNLVTSDDSGSEQKSEASESVTKPEPGDIEMSPQNRAKGEKILAELLYEAKVTEQDETAVVVAEIAARPDGAEYRQLSDPRDVTNTGLKYVVDVLREMKQQGRLYDFVGEALNAATLREAGLADGS